MELDTVVVERKSSGLGVLLTVGLALTLIAGAALLTGCESPAAQREQAHGSRVLAEAQAYELRLQAGTAAAAERAALREATREASHQRALEMLPYVLVILGALLLAGLGGLVFWDLRARPQPNVVDPSVLLEIQRLQLQQAGMERSLYRAIAAMQRQALHAGTESGEMIVIDPRRP